jgi:hypothetical protein
VACSPETPPGGGVGDAEVVSSVPEEELVAAGSVPGEAPASTKEIARKPRPTAAAAEAVHAVPRRRMRFMDGACGAPG